MDSSTNSGFPGSFEFSKISSEELEIIRQAENQINQDKQDKVILIAYDKNQQ